MVRSTLAPVVLVALAAAACTEIEPTPVPPELSFDPAAGVLPFPHDLLFTGSVDGTLEIPVEEEAPASDPRRALNDLDGFARTAPIRVPLSRAIDDASVVPGKSVRVFSVTTTGPAGLVTGVVRELVGGREFVAVNVDAPAAIVVVPTVPFAGQAIAVAITNDVNDQFGVAAAPSRVYKLARGKTALLDADGKSTRPDLIDDADAAALEPLRRIVSATESALAPFGLDEDNVVLSFTFTLQSTVETFDSLSEDVELDLATGALADAAAVGDDALFDTSAIGGAGLADVHLAAFRLPSYLPPDDPLTGHFTAAEGAPVTRFARPVAVTDIVVPALVTVPSEASGRTEPATGWPVAIFQHGITGDRTQLLLLADALANAGFVGVAIDLPLHGLTGDDDHPFAGLNDALDADADGFEDGAFDDLAPTERAPEVDVLSNETGAAGSDGVTDRSGAHFINLASVLSTRDAIRQAVADLMRVRRAAPSLDLDDDGSADLDGDRVFFVGHSLGAIVGTVLLGVDGDAWSGGVLANGGGGIAPMLLGSETFGPIITDGLNALGVKAGTPDFDAFFVAAQTAVDAADPAVFAAGVRAPFVFIQQAGDTVVPNVVDGAPLSGTEPLLRLLDTVAVTERLQGADLRAAVRFNRGGHTSLLDPSDDPELTAEMQGVVARFLASGGALVTVDEDLVAPVPGS